MFSDYQKAVHTAIEVLQDCEIDSVPVDPMIIVNQKRRTIRCEAYSVYMEKYGCTLEDVEAFADSEDGVCFYKPSSEKYLILYNDVDPKKRLRKRFTVAHELGHIFLKHLEKSGTSVMHRGALSEEEYQILVNTMKSARDDFIRRALGREEYSIDSDVSLDDILVDGSKEPEKLIKRAENWNGEIDERLEKEFQKVLRMYEANPKEGFVKALTSACNLPLDSDNHTSCYAIKKLMESFDDEVAYGSDYGIISESCGDLHAKLRDNELREIREYPEGYFIATINVDGE